MKIEENSPLIWVCVPPVNIQELSCIFFWRNKKINHKISRLQTRTHTRVYVMKPFYFLTSCNISVHNWIPSVFVSKNVFLFPTNSFSWPVLHLCTEAPTPRTTPLCPLAPPTLSLTLPRLAASLSVQHFIKVTLNKTLVLVAAAAAAVARVCTVCAQCEAETGKPTLVVCPCSPTARLKASPWRPDAYASRLGLGNERGSLSNTLQI